MLSRVKPSVAFIATETLEQGKQRIVQELFGGSSFEEERAVIVKMIENANELFLEDISTFDIGSFARSEQWIIQESHDGQRRPILLSIGSDKFIYKPRSIGIEVAFNGLLDWYANKIGQQFIYPVEYTLFSSWGLAKLVEHRPCDDEEAVRRYYWRLGILAALIWVIGGADITGSNIVACGEFPAIIDAEMALVPGNDIFCKDLAVEFRRGAIGPFSAPDVKGVNISYGAASLSSVNCIHLRSKKLSNYRCPRCHHVPFIEDTAHPLIGYEESLNIGFLEGLNILKMNNRELLKASSPLSAFHSTMGRVVFRPTAAYAFVREWLFRNWRDNNLLPEVDNLLSKIPTKHHLYQKLNLCSIERRALINGDIPRFEMMLSESKFTFEGEQVVQFKYSGLNRAHERLKCLTTSTVDTTSVKWKSYVLSAVGKL